MLQTAPQEKSGANGEEFGEKAGYSGREALVRYDFRLGGFWYREAGSAATRGDCNAN
jgi:hypothetical protein